MDLGGILSSVYILTCRRHLRVLILLQTHFKRSRVSHLPEKWPFFHMRGRVLVLFGNSWVGNRGVFVHPVWILYIRVKQNAGYGLTYMSEVSQPSKSRVRSLRSPAYTCAETSKGRRTSS